ncbi:hypothetical protein [Janthinobacterium sp. NKUCC08_JDC]|uniref:hypothetical protein n=1 Tax=Janthinobacterium sp. NKUCC08_JDC TaxID=2842122 RepID=UPI001C5AC351|nr:hypothetical protein [Janthinobacterium sp. NKUCC08_JDC]MBW3497746.1 hypothetical protein [Janthinobacterium sp. NKUCC08_JDC]
MAVDHRVSPLKKSDLQYDYPKSVSAGDDPSKRNEPDRSLLNRSEWYEVLYFCNRFANQNSSGKKEVALKVERLIKDGFVPSNLHSHDNIEKYLLNHWLATPD